MSASRLESPPNAVSEGEKLTEWQVIPVFHTADEVAKSTDWPLISQTGCTNEKQLARTEHFNSSHFRIYSTLEARFISSSLFVSSVQVCTYTILSPLES